MSAGGTGFGDKRLSPSLRLPSGDPRSLRLYGFPPAGDPRLSLVSTASLRRPAYLCRQLVVV
ncbi:hypothetical protein J31TS4_36680 [Paenibacillus sp. J31TS4]|nr:hypothetical protein J31TS4_36680 [Paenibacillus sp. J31TS4]